MGGVVGAQRRALIEMTLRGPCGRVGAQIGSPRSVPARELPFWGAERRRGAPKPATDDAGGLVGEWSARSAGPSSRRLVVGPAGGLGPRSGHLDRCPLVSCRFEGLSGVVGPPRWQLTRDGWPRGGVVGAQRRALIETTRRGPCGRVGAQIGSPRSGSARELPFWGAERRRGAPKVATDARVGGPSSRRLVVGPAGGWGPRSGHLERAARRAARRAPRGGALSRAAPRAACARCASAPRARPASAAAGTRAARRPPRASRARRPPRPPASAAGGRRG
ncbi:ribosomal protein L37AE/L43A [Frigoribacterium sp. PvP120]